MSEKTHYRKAFHSPYLSSADIVEPVAFTISRVVLAKDETKKTKDSFNTAYFVEKELRPGEPLKPMILNAGNSKTMAALTGSKFIEDWANTRVTIYVDGNVKFGRETVEGLRISREKTKTKQPLVKDSPEWKNAVDRYKKDKNFTAIEKFRTISDENKELIKKEAEK